MRTISEEELDYVSGGLCENMSIETCVTGAAEAVASELEMFFRSLNRWGGDLGIWIYETTHC